ncbi:MAG: phosphoribosylamine--glycine ligase [Lentimicrobiaceae bacterium]|nr:phosphoribosylamine--glycine ligase [Lentimicrobiaceae bacterium]
MNKKLNVLILGSGGREHAFAYMVSKSEKLNNLYVAPGNGGTNQIASNVNIDISDFKQVEDFIIANNIDMLIVGPEAPLVAGIVDYLQGVDKLSDLLIIGPDKTAAQLEGSKDFAKRFMKKYNIPTAKYKSFNKNEVNDAIAFLKTLKPPYVLKADGLAAGKGVIITQNFDEAVTTVNQMLIEEKFAKASSTILIEEFLSGIELSVFALTDGKNYVLLPEAKDYKKIGDNDTGANTGGMGAVSPVPFFDKEFKNKVINKIVEPTINGIRQENFNYKGFVFFGLINVDNEPYVIEYNVRMGDPEAQVVLPRIKTDLLELLEYVGLSRLNEAEVEIDNRVAVGIVAASGGYPDAYKKGIKIVGNTNTNNDDNIVFHAGTVVNNGELLTNGGRVLVCTALDSTISKAVDKSYKLMSTISFDKMYYRSDIGKDLLNL